MNRKRINEIIKHANDIKDTWGNNPFYLAKRYGINIISRPGNGPSARLLKLSNYPATIFISGCPSERGQIVLCAHELGHFLLTDRDLSRYTGTYNTLINEEEYEANLFAVALLFNESDFRYPINQMSNYTLKQILDYNLRTDS